MRPSAFRFPREKEGESFRPATERADRAWGGILRVAVAAAVLVHIAIFLSLRTVRAPISPFAAAGPDRGDIAAAEGGGGGLQAIQFRVQPPQVAVAQPAPAPTPEDIEIAEEPLPEQISIPDAAIDVTLAIPGTGVDIAAPAAGQGEGAGTTTGSGEGAGGSAENGRSGMIAPVPRGMILPPADRPRGVRGQEITVWVFVTDRGRVATDSTRLEPPTRDGKYNRRLKQSAAEWVFEPARRGGSAVGAWYPYQIIL